MDYKTPLDLQAVAELDAFPSLQSVLQYSKGVLLLWQEPVSEAGSLTLGPSPSEASEPVGWTEPLMVEEV